jgi:hypothetical protein
MNETMVTNFRRSAAKRKIVRNLVVLCSLFLITPKTVAAQATTLSITPPVVEILIAPGKKLVQNFTFKADGDNVTVIPEIHLVKPQDSHGHVIIDPKPYSPSSIPLTITSNHPLGKPITLKNNELSLSLTFDAASVDMSEDIYLALVLKVGSAEELQAASATFPAISALIFATINPSGVTPVDLSIENFDLALFHDSYLPLTISPTLKNNVPIMLRPRGTYEVVNSAGKIIYSLPLYPNLILGESTRAIQASEKELPTSLTWSPSWKNLGPYRLRLTIKTEGGTKIIEVEKPIWILPIRGIILVTLASIVALVIFLQRKRRLDKKSIDT